MREFFSALKGFLHDGFPLDGEGLGKLTKVFEGEEDHKLLIPNDHYYVLLRNAGFYKSVGRMIAHPFLHGGPSLRSYDLREALKEVSTTVRS